MGKPPSEVMCWPQSDIALLKAYLAREPASADRIEIAIAYLTALTANLNRGKDAPARKIEKFMLFRNAWKSKEEQEGQEAFSDIDDL